ncbi:hypothetical protein OEA41_000931 [Lepraria neglecta]|uniref:F-box domain-containing protein n=1 Tax=Lepraria neglecta TaxID=209136 RepID=A0AAE0DPX0_9LECA|nr:hypothetical protein OEA41_000931 [Lepraria neglecta]
MTTFTSLPPEITREILHYLPIAALLAFGLTSKTNHSIQQHSLSSLRLGVFNSRLGGMISLMEATADRSCLHSVQMILPKSECRKKDKVIRNQNLRIANVVEKYTHTLRDLEIACWELQESAAMSLAQLKNLKRLSIRLDHPHTRFSGLEPSFWETAPGSPVWNLLASKKGEKGKSALGRLQSLNLERAGITDYQLAKILESNPNIRELSLRKCVNLTDKIFKILAEGKVGRKLEVLHFTKCCGVEIDERVLDHIGRLPNLKELSLHGCYSLDSDLVKKLNDEQWHIEDLTLPSTPSSPKQGVEIDPEYK